MSERGKIIKGEVAYFKVRLRLVGENGKVHDYAWRTIKGVQGIERAKAMAVAMMEDQRAPGVKLTWEPLFVQGIMKEVKK